MGVFDSNQSNKKYNDATPNYDVNDGVDIVPCSENGCRFRDVEKGICVFETCIYKQFPLSIPYHDKMTKVCKSCGEKYVLEFNDFINPLCSELPLCPKCENTLFNLIKSGR